MNLKLSYQDNLIKTYRNMCTKQISDFFYHSRMKKHNFKKYNTEETAGAGRTQKTCGGLWVVGVSFDR